MRSATQHFRSLFRHRFHLALVLSALLITPVFLSGCGRTDSDVATTPTPAPSKAPVKKEGNYITADPNPVPAGPEPRGKTMITWHTEGYPPEQVIIYVSASGRPETPYAGGEVTATREAPWIAVDEPQEFRLYGGTGANRKLLDKVVVTRLK